MTQLSMEMMHKLKTEFAKWDKNGDGTLDYGEMAALLRSGNPEMEDAELRELLEHVDTNRDGRVDFIEFVVYIYGGPVSLEAVGCSRPGCPYLQHPTMGIGFCCRACRHCGQHGPACERKPKAAPQPQEAPRYQPPQGVYLGQPQEHLVFERVYPFSLDGRGRASAPNLDSWNLPWQNRPYSISVCIKLHGPSGVIAYWGDVNESSSCIGLHVDSPTVLNHFWGSNDLRATGLNLGDQQWHHILATYDGRERSLWVDHRRLARDAPETPNQSPYQDNLVVGFIDLESVGPNIACLKAELKELRVYDCGLYFDERGQLQVCRRQGAPEPAMCDGAMPPGETVEKAKARHADLKKRYRERTEHFQDPQGFIITAIESRAVALLRGNWLIERARQGKPVALRKDLPPEAFWTPQEAIAMFRRSAAEHKKKGPEGGGDVGYLGLWLVAISYAWAHPDHCDPECFHLKRIATVLTSLARLRQRYGLFEDVGVFWDNMSYFQREPTRTPYMKELASFGMYVLNYIYCHDLSLVLKFKAMPPCYTKMDETGYYEKKDLEGNVKRFGWWYDLRGWPTFEDVSSNSRSAMHWSRLTFAQGVEDLSWNNHNEVSRFSSQSTFVHPRTFFEMIKTRPCTSGSDEAMIRDSYVRLFKIVSQASTQKVTSVKWTREQCQDYAECLGECHGLQSYWIAASSLGQDQRGSTAECLRILTAPLKDKKKLGHFGYQDNFAKDDDIPIILENMPPSLNHLSFHHHHLTDAGIETLARELPRRLPNLKILQLSRTHHAFHTVSEKGQHALRTALPKVQLML